jgi:hypothetical protein
MSSTYRDKLLQYAPEPPQKVWDEIAKSLDAATPALSEKLYQFETAPPAGVWEKINNKLGNNQPAKVIPFFQKHKTVLRYSAAAAILIFIVAASIFFSQEKEAGNIAGIPVEQQSQKGKTNADASVPSLQSKNTLLAETKDDESSVQKNSPAEKQSLLHHLPSQTQLGAVELAKNFIPEVAEQKQTVDAATAVEKYMVYSDDDGNAMKLPKKLFDFISCVKENILCKEEMQQLQEKFAAADFSNDFTGVLEMIKNLKENQ